jgi:peroxiredoxin
LVGVQQSSGWEEPRADQDGWRRTDTVWLIPRLGVAQKVERVIEHRDPGRQVATHKSTMVYEMESSLQYPGELSKDRRREIMVARQFAETLTPLQAKGPRYMKQLEALQARVDNHLENQPPTPYREAIIQIKHRVEAARRGESPPAPITLVKDRPPAVAEMGSAAPDFAATDFNGRQSVRLKSLLGKPAVLVFYNPKSRTAEEQLLFAQQTHEAHLGVLRVVGFPMSDDAEVVEKQRTYLHLTILLLQGSGLRQSYAVIETPKVIILDAKGIVRGSYVGWGSETGPAVLADLKRILAAP